MAIDSQIKRQAIASISSFFVGPTVIPDGSFDQQDRIQIGYGYPFITEILKQLSESGSGSDTISQVLASLGLSDTGAGAEAFVPSASVPITDTGSGADAINVLTEALIELAESMYGQDFVLGSYISVLANVSDTGTSSDIISQISVALSTSDSGSGVDSITVLAQAFKVIADTASGLDALGINVSLNISDTTSGVDGITIETGALKAISDSGLGVDAIAQILTSLYSVNDIASGSDNIYLNVNIQISDIGSGVEAVSKSITAAKQIIDSGVGLDELVLATSLQLDDTCTAVDVLGQISAILSLIDNAGGIDTAFAYDASTRIVEIQFTLRNRSSVEEFSTGSINFTLH